MKRKSRLFRSGVLAAVMALGAMTGDWCVKAVFAAATAPGVICSTAWGIVQFGVGNNFWQPYTNYGCDGAGREVAIGTGTISCVGGVCSATGPCPYWPGNQWMPIGRSGTCDCSLTACSGTCQSYCSMGTNYIMSNTCVTSGSGCACTFAPCVGMGYYDNSGTCGRPTCTGNCNYTSVSSGPGTYHWSLVSNTCTAGVTGCSCPGIPDLAPCPESFGETYSVACGWPEGTCKPKVSDPPPCSGSCQYVANTNGEGLLIWALASNNCTAGAENCSCPSSPGGPCPTSVASETSVACGAAGGPCDRGSCTGNCNYRSVSTGDGNFTWQPDPDHPNTCKRGVENCTCPSEPGGDCPQDALATKTVVCGSASTPCKKKPCAAHGGDEDNDGCCADVDFDDDDAAVCSSDCKGTYSLCEACTKTDPSDSSRLVACDSGTEGCRCAKCDPKTDTEFCRCRTVNNGDKDKDNCCDAVDKWPDDPKRGCECCEWAEVWNSNGGPEYAVEFNRVFGSTAGNGPLEQFVTYNSSTKTWTTNTPSGSPTPLTVPVPLAAFSGGRVSNTTFTIPLTVPQVEDSLTSLGVGDMTGQFAAVDVWRGWWRVACTWLCGFILLKYLFQELRV